MTKKAMIQAIQQREAAMFLELKETERMYGSESQVTQQLRSQWCAVNRLMDVVGIPTDFRLPDNVKALTIIQERVAKHRAQA